MCRTRSLSFRFLKALPLVLPLAMGAWPVAAGPSPTETAKLEPRLLQAAENAPEDTVSAWVEFTDKGELSPFDLAQRLAATEAALTPRARARRVRAHVHPLVDYLDLPVEPSYLDALRGRGFRPYGASRWFNRVAVRAPAREVSRLADLTFVRLLTSVEVMQRTLEPEGVGMVAPPPRRPAGLSAVAYGLTQAMMDQVHLPAVHDSAYTGAGRLICVLDEGFNYFDKHEATRDLVIPTDRQRDFYRGLETAQDTTDPTLVHGTWVLGVIGGRKFGTYVGSAFDADFMLGRTEVRNFERRIEMVYWGMGAEWADSLGADVINCSLGYTTFDSPDPSYTYANMNGHTTIITRAAEVAASKGILVVAAVGNDGADNWRYLSAPSDANGDSVLAVGAVDLYGVTASFSSYGPSSDGRVKPDLAARGVSCPTVGTSGAPDLYSVRDGTSFATPVIAGAAACLMQARPSWSARDVALALRSAGSQAVAPDDRQGYGIPNVLTALDYVPVPPPPPPVVKRLALTSTGPNPIVFARGLGRFTIAVPPSLCRANASVRVRDALGRTVRALWSGMVSCPALPLTWDGRDDDGRAVPAGLYLVDARVGSERVTLRLVGLP